MFKPLESIVLARAFDSTKQKGPQTNRPDYYQNPDNDTTRVPIRVAQQCDEDRESMSAKFWLDPDVSLEANYGYKRRELRDIELILRDNLEKLRYEWDEFCNSSADTR